MLTQAELEAFERDGCVGPFRVRSEEQMAQLCRDIQPLLDDPKGPPWANLTMDVHMLNEHVYRLGADPAIVDRIRSIIGDDVLFWRAWTFVKKPGAKATGVHRDGRQDQTWPTVDKPRSRVGSIARAGSPRLTSFMARLRSPIERLERSLVRRQQSITSS